MGGRLNIPPEVFMVRPDGTGRTMIHSGAPFTILIRPAYDVLVAGLEAAFSVMGEATVRRIPSDFKPLEPCHEVANRQAFTGFPWITFHFDNNADLNLDALNAFYMVKNEAGNIEFCFAMIPDDKPHGMTSIGAFQQTNHRFIYDTKGFKLLFGPENCFETS